jgi:hypothetical protein
MQDWRTSTHARRGDQTVQRLADRHARAPGTAVQLRRQSEVVQTIETQHRKCLQVTFDEARFFVRAKALEDLGEHDVGEGDRLAPSISSTQRSACGESLSFRTSIQTLVSTTITNARDGSRQDRPPSGHAPADRARRCVDGERPALAKPHPLPHASSALRSAPGLREAHGRRSRCSSSYTTEYASKGACRAQKPGRRGRDEDRTDAAWRRIRELHAKRLRARS